MNVAVWVAAAGTLVAVFLLILLISKQNRVDTESIGSTLREEIRQSRTDSNSAAKELRAEVAKHIKSSTETLVKTVGELGKSQSERLEAITKSVETLISSNEQRIEKVRETLDLRIRNMQESNETKLDEMRQTVDEKLQSTLEKRLTESFKVVSDNLEAVQRGLGEMQTLASGVGDLKRVLTNVKSRGTWGEVQLGALLEDILTPDQFERNVKVNPSSSEIVEFAVRLPGQDPSDSQAYVYLPIDSKFPQEDYQRLVEASEAADASAELAAASSLLRTLQSSAKEIRTKYVLPPHTTDFAIMFLPTEGLYAEVLRKPGLVEELQSTHHVMVAGPTTLAALLTSLRMGFRTLAIEKRSSEVWSVLGAVKTEFGKFGDVLAKVKKQLDTASRTIDQTGVRTRAMERKLRTVEELPASQAKELLQLGEPDPEDEGDAIELA